jgi:hypothetical protein
VLVLFHPVFKKAELFNDVGFPRRDAFHRLCE